MDDYYDPIPGQTLPPEQGTGPTPGDEPPPFQPPPPAAGVASIPLNGLKLPQALVDAAFPGYTVQGDSLVWTGASPQFSRDPQQVLGTLKGYADPLNAGNWKGYFDSIYGKRGANQTGLLDPQSMKLLQAAGFQVSPKNQAGFVTKVQAPDKHWYRVIDGDPQSGGSWSWIDQGTESGPGSNGSDGGFGIDPSYLAPWDKDFKYPEFGGVSDDDLHADKSFQFRRDNAVGAYQNSSAYKGLLNSSNAPYDIATLADALAGQEFGSIFNRKFDTWKTSRDNAYEQYKNQQDTFYKNQNSPFDKIMRVSDQGLDAAKS